MTYTFDNLKSDVRKEAEALRVHATKEERERLDFSNLDPEVYDECIYGQMTGDCNSFRGIQLIEICAVRYVKDGDLTDIIHEGFERIKKHVNGERVENLFDKRNGSFSWDEIHYSAIEAYILLPEACNANLIAYLRGETETLEL